METLDKLKQTSQNYAKIKENYRRTIKIEIIT